MPPKPAPVRPVPADLRLDLSGVQMQPTGGGVANTHAASPPVPTAQTQRGLLELTTSPSGHVQAKGVASERTRQAAAQAQQYAARQAQEFARQYKGVFTDVTRRSPFEVRRNLGPPPVSSGKP
jgi:hypothetical protein